VKSAPGYLAPEYITQEKATEACDVYSFGVLLLELASGRRPVEAASETKVSAIQDWAFFLARERRFDEIADKNLGGKYSESELKRIVLVALTCTQQEAEKRPRMGEVVAVLTGESKEMLSNLELDRMYRPEEKIISQMRSGLDELAKSSDI
jgi:serine/threonine protein kinase